MLERIHLAVEFLSQPRTTQFLHHHRRSREAHRLSMLTTTNLHTADDPTRWLYTRYQWIRKAWEKRPLVLLMVCLMLTVKLFEDVPKNVKLFVSAFPSITQEMYVTMESAVLLLFDFDLVMPEAMVEKKRAEIMQIF
jgi:hypothetical protein